MQREKKNFVQLIESLNVIVTLFINVKNVRLLFGILIIKLNIEIFI